MSDYPAADRLREGKAAYGNIIRRVAEGGDLLAPGSLSRKRGVPTPDAIADNAVREILQDQLKGMNIFQWMQSTVKPEDVAAVKQGEPTFDVAKPVYVSFLSLPLEAFETAKRLGKDEGYVMRHFTTLMREMVGTNAPLAIRPEPNTHAVLVVMDREGIEEFKKKAKAQSSVRA